MQEFVWMSQRKEPGVRRGGVRKKKKEGGR